MLLKKYSKLIINLQKQNFQEMGPKKKAEPGAQDNAERVQFLTNKLKALQTQVIWEQQRADRSKTQEKMLRDQIVRIDQQFKKQREKLDQISDKMSQQYSNAQLQLKTKVQEKKSELQKKQDQITKSQQTLKNSKAEYDQRLKQKQKQLNDLRQKMQDMSIEFSRMLRETLQKMQERIQLQQWDNESDPQLIKKMKDLSDLYSN